VAEGTSCLAQAAEHEPPWPPHHRAALVAFMSVIHRTVLPKPKRDHPVAEGTARAEFAMTQDAWWLAISIAGLLLMLGALLYAGFA